MPMERQGAVVSREELLAGVSGVKDFVGEAKTLDVHIRWVAGEARGGSQHAASHRHRARPRVPFRCLSRPLWRPASCFSSCSSILGVVGIIGVLMLRPCLSLAMHVMRGQLQNTATLLQRMYEAVLTPTPAVPQAADLPVRVTVIAPDGRVLQDTHSAIPQEMENTICCGRRYRLPSKAPKATMSARPATPP